MTSPPSSQFAYRRTLAFLARLSTVVRRLAPGATITYNHATDAAMRDKLAFQTHLEIESLPTSTHQWGYLHYPIVARQARVHGLPFVGMTGRFHRSWADFGGLKTLDQLTYECATILSAGGRISVGDQLRPRGELDPAVYRLIGAAFERVEALEPWLNDTAATTDLAIICVGRQADRGGGVFSSVRSPDLEGAAQLLLEIGIQFDIVDPDPAILARYAVIILPEGTPLDADGRAAVQAYLDAGGRLIVSGTAGLNETGEPWLGGLPAEDLGPAPTNPTYLRLDPALAHSGGLAVDYDYACYVSARLLRPRHDATSHGELRRALFDRTWEHFTSHAQAPVGDPLGTPIVVHDDRVLQFAAPLFLGYRDSDYWVYREIVRSMLDAFLPDRAVRVHGPGWIEVGLLQQARSGDRSERLIVHLTAYQPRRTFQSVPHVDQSWPVVGVGLDLRVSDPPTAVYLAPDRTSVPFVTQNGRLEIALPPLGVHTVLVVESS